MNKPCPKCGEYHNQCFELKELSDEEILEICNQFEEADMTANGDSEWSIPSGDYLYFARAILRKAQEND